MELRTLGKTGFEISVLGFGGSEIGGSDQANVARLLGSALDAGLNVIDTGECYGQSEELIGKAVAHRRSEYRLFTKVGHTSGLPGSDWDISMMEESIDRSLKRLKTDCLDLLQLHSCTESQLRQGDVIEVARRAREGGKTRFIGYSGDANDALYAVECGAFDTLQTSINIADQQAIELTLPKAKALGMGVIAKRPLANIAWQNGDRPPSWDYPRPYWERLQKLRYDWLGPEDMDKSVSTALRFVLAQEAVATAIVGTQNPARWSQNAAFLAEGSLPQPVIDSIRFRWRETAEPDWTGER